MPRKKTQTPTILKNEWVDEVACQSIKHGYVALDDLVYVLAKEKLYTDVLPELWKKYECDLRGSRTPKVASARDRIGTWKTLLYRWAFRTVAGVRSKFRISIPPLPVYSYEEVTGNLKDYDMEKMNGPCFITLNDLKSYFEKTIGLPLPSRLFPHKEAKEGFSHKKLNSLLLPPIVEKSERKKDKLAERLPIEGNYENVFRQEGPSWTIIYEGKTLSGLKGRGFEIIHFLVQNKDKSFHVSKLSKEIDKIDPNYIQTSDNLNSDMEHKPSDKGTVDGRDMIYGNSLQDFKEYRRDLKNELRVAEENNDTGRIEKLKVEMEEFESYASSYLTKDGKSRKFSDDTIKAKERIRKRITRALAVIKKHDENTWRHFNRSLGPINFSLSYTPDKNIDWLT
jgi:hypothetical protein